MIEEIARVVATEDDQAIIVVEKTSSCSSCQAKGACGTSSLAAYFNFQPPKLTVDNTLNARVGDQVIVGMPENVLVAGSFLLYIVPLLSLILFALFASFFLESFWPGVDTELSQVIAGLVGLGIGFKLVKLFSAGLLKDRNGASMLRIIPQSPNKVSVTELQL